MPDIYLLYRLVGWFVFLTSAGFGNPIPEEVMIISAGITTAQMGQYGPWRWLMLPACMLGALGADVILYGIGRAFGEWLQRYSWFNRLAPPEKQEHIRENLHRYGIVIFVIGRLVPGIRTTLFLTAGTTRLPLWKFCLADGAGALVGTSLFFLLGYALGAQFLELIESLEQKIMPYKTIFLILVLMLVGAYLLYRYLRQPIPTGDPEEVPLIGHQIATALPDQHPDPAPTPDSSGPEEAARAQTSASEQTR